jgi:kinetochore protein Nuf2
MSFAADHNKSLANAIDFKSGTNNKFGNLQQPPKETFSFPIMKTEEICKCLTELNIHINMEELQNPEKNINACHHMYELLVEVCTSLTRDDISQPAFSGLQNIQYPDLHEHSIPKINLMRACAKMMDLCEIKGFTIKDFISPTAKRLRQHLSGIINFAKFREERLLLLADLGSQRQILLDHANSSKDNNFVLNNRLSLLREQTSEEGAQISKLEAECREMDASISMMNALQNSIKEESASLTALNKDLKERIAQASVQFEDSTVLHKKLAVQIVSSPEKFRKLIVEVGQNLQLEQKDAKHAERKVRDLSAWLTNVEEAHVEVLAALDSVNEVRAEVERQKGVILDLDAKKQGTQSKRVEMSEVDQNLSQVRRHVSRAEDKLSHLRKQSTQKGDEAQRAVEDLHQQLIDAEARRVQVAALHLL